MANSVEETILQQLEGDRILDPHSHINPHDPASTTLADILGYHYYTELVNAVHKLAKEIEAARSNPKQLFDLLIPRLPSIRNTVQYSWLVELCQTFYTMQGEDITVQNAERLWEVSSLRMKSPTWVDHVKETTKLDAIFLTNDFDDPLAGFDTSFYVPCLRTDELVFHFGNPAVRARLGASTGIEVKDAASLRDALEARFKHFVAHGARACAISLPSTFAPEPTIDTRLDRPLQDLLLEKTGPHVQPTVSNAIFWMLAELCDKYQLPFDLMIGVTRNVYPGGVHQGRDLYDARVSLHQYEKLFNAFPNVTFPISVLPSGTVNQELVSYAWIFPNVVANGHWWYSNIPAYIEADGAARLQAIPEDKVIWYYSDAYKLEFVQPKFAMARRILARILANHFVGDRRWSEAKAIELGRKVLRGNSERIFKFTT
ncbi:MAG: amidohydrolase [Bdellovibrionota bacterium]